MPSDDELIERIRRRDECAFDALFARHAPVVRRRAVRIVRDESAADDLVQEVFLRLWTRADQFSGQGTVAGWLIRIATNLALNHVRSVRRRRRQPLEAPRPSGGPVDWLIDEEAPDPEKLLELTERRELLGRLVDELPEEKQELLHMIQDEEMNHREVAEALGIPPGTVKSRMHHIRKRLAEAWKEIAGEWEDV